MSHCDVPVMSGSCMRISCAQHGKTPKKEKVQPQRYSSTQRLGSARLGSAHPNLVEHVTS
jgi:hypothetical protein